jgi:dihydrofolate reductase
VVSNTLRESTWSNSVFIGGDVVAELRKLKEQDGPPLQVHGSGNLIQTLLKHDLVDELWLKTFPITLGKGKRLFEDGTSAAAFALQSSTVLPSGVVVANYQRSGDVQTGSF